MRIRCGRWAGLGAGLLLLVTAGCGGSSSAVSTSGLPTGETLPSGGNGVPMRTQVGVTERTLNLVSWRGFVPAGIVAPFRAATGCAVSVTYAPSAGQMLAMMHSGEFDGASAPGEVAGRLIARHDVAPIDTSLIPDFGRPHAQAAVASGNHSRGRPLRGRLHVGCQPAGVQHDCGASAAHELERRVRRAQLRRGGDGAGLADVHRRCSPLPRVG